MQTLWLVFQTNRKTNHNVCILFPKPTTTFAFYFQNQPQRLHFIPKTNHNVCILFPKPTTTFAFYFPNQPQLLHFPNQPLSLYFISQTNHNVCILFPKPTTTLERLVKVSAREANDKQFYSHSNTIAVPGDDNLSNTNN